MDKCTEKSEVHTLFDFVLSSTFSQIYHPQNLCGHKKITQSKMSQTLRTKGWLCMVYKRERQRKLKFKTIATGYRKLLIKVFMFLTEYN